MTSENTRLRRHVLRWGSGSLARGAYLAELEYKASGGRVDRKGYLGTDDCARIRAEMLKPPTYDLVPEEDYDEPNTEAPTVVDQMLALPFPDPRVKKPWWCRVLKRLLVY